MSPGYDVVETEIRIQRDRGIRATVNDLRSRITALESEVERYREGVREIRSAVADLHRTAVGETSVSSYIDHIARDLLSETGGDRG